MKALRGYEGAERREQWSVAARLGYLPPGFTPIGIYLPRGIWRIMSPLPDDEDPWNIDHPGRADPNGHDPTLGRKKVSEQELAKERFLNARIKGRKVEA